MKVRSILAGVAMMSTLSAGAATAAPVAAQPSPAISQVQAGDKIVKTDHYRVWLPGNPKKSVGSTKTPAGKVRYTMYKSTADGRLFMSMSLPLGPSQGLSLPAVVTGFARGLKGRVVSKKPMKQQGFKGLHGVVKSRSKGGTSLTSHVLLFRTDGALVQVIMAARTDDRGAAGALARLSRSLWLR